MENISTQTKSQLAKLLATENITVQHNPSAKTASFDLKNRILTLPVLQFMSGHIYDMLVIHEVGHALDTPLDAWIDSIEQISKKVSPKNPGRVKAAVKDFLNVAEDVRIDKRQKRRYPGSRTDYIKGYRQLIENNFFGTAGRDINSFSFIDKANLYYKGGIALGIKFSSEERDFLNQLGETETFDEVVKLTEEIFLWSKDKLVKSKEEEQKLNQEDESEDSESDDYESYSDSFDESEDDEDEESSDGSDSEYSDSDDDSDGSESGEASDDDEDLEESPSSSDEKSKSDDGGEDDVPEAITEKIWNEKSKELFVDDDSEYVYVKLPKPNLEKIVDDYKKVLDEQNFIYNTHWVKDPTANTIIQQFEQFKKAENSTISYMVKEFEMKKAADAYSRTSTARTGIIDMNKLHSYKFSDDIFLKMTKVADGKNHGFVIFIDWSSSMLNTLNGTIKQLYSIVMFCRRAQIPFEVYSFKTATGSDFREQFSTNDNELFFNRGFRLRNILSSKMSIVQTNESLRNLWLMSRHCSFKSDQLSSTPLNQAIVAGIDIVNNYQKKNKFQVINTIFLTDGESDPCNIVNISSYSFGKKRKYIIQDSVMKKDYNLAHFHSKCLTNTLLQIFKARTNSNLIGFYLTDSSIKSIIQQIPSLSSTEAVKLKTSWKDNNFLVMPSPAYDSYYYINAKMLNFKNEELSVNSKMTKRQVEKAFISFSDKKKINRVLLNRFINEICD